MLWLMTQNKKSLLCVKDVSVKGRIIEGFIENSLLDQWTKVLGKYDSDERALAVLHELFLKIEESEGAIVSFKMPEK